MFYDHGDVMSSGYKNMPMTIDELVRKVPAVVAEHPHESRSDKYAFVPTLPVVQTLMRLGYQPHDAQKAAVRDMSRENFQRHLIRFRHASNKQNSRDGVAELVLIAAHDGTSSYRMLAGWFRFICSNGLISGEKAAEFRVRHQGSQAAVLQAVKDGSQDMLEYLNGMAARSERFQNIMLSDSEQLAFAKAALDTRYENGKSPLRPDQLLLPRRMEEAREIGNGYRARLDLNTTFNVVQETLVRGGVPYHDANARRRTTRPVKAITKSVGINRALWTLAEEMAKIKAA